jgi:outer membrane protein OmpA-like peptidoglycan-associated protein
MNRMQEIAALPCLAALLVTGASTGCATKKFVRQTVAPIEAKVGELEKKTTEQGADIEELEKSVSRAAERAETANAAAAAANQEAVRAGERASAAGKAAEEARSLAQKGLHRADDVEQALGARIENMDNYVPVSTETVLFGFNRSDLTDEAKAQLDTFARSVTERKHYRIEVQGFADRSGPQDYNLELSRKRAAAVVRYLTLQHKIPLHRIHVMGYGSEAPVADNTTREGRKRNRRVEVRLLAAEQGPVSARR